MKSRVQKYTTNESGEIISFKVEEVVWNPPKRVLGGTSKSTLEVRALEVGDVKRIYHPELRCGYYEKVRGRVCSLQPTIGQLRKRGWELEHYHEDDHIIVIRRLK